MFVGGTVCSANSQCSVRATPYRGVGRSRTVIGQHLGGMFLEDVQRHGILGRMPEILTVCITVIERCNRAWPYNLVVGDKTAATVAAGDTIDDRFICEGIRCKHTDDGGLRKV